MQQYSPVTSGRQTETDPAYQAEEEVIVGRVLRGEVDEFALLIERYQVKVSAMARRYLLREEDAEDAIQTVFIKAFQRLKDWRREAPFEHWLSRIALRVCLDKLRKEKRRPEILFSEFSAEEEDWVVHFRISPEAASSRSGAARELVRRAMESLSPKARLMVDLFEIQGKTAREISALTGWSVAGVKMRAFRARLQLKKVLKKLMNRIDLA
ncbi:MAG: sigma-70 family RNA polymerase sigma factor [Verrucomicrobiae bacterium]|nr:sigma-70 family RNA polymerase sigma factor [Verrucomicrobiae bacterium]